VSESGWLTATDPSSMLDLLTGQVSDRKLRLLASACCHRIWHLFADQRSRNAVGTSERFADGLTAAAEVKAATRSATDAVGAVRANTGGLAGRARYTRDIHAASAARHLGDKEFVHTAMRSCVSAAAYASGVYGSPEWHQAERAERIAQCRLVRDVVGPPFQPLRLPARWRSGPGRRCARRAEAIYAANRFDELTQLADDLERDGCPDREAVSHCRSMATHIRGCWVIDALTGREAGVRKALIGQGESRAGACAMELMRFLARSGSQRQWQLLGVALCRRAWHLLDDPRSRDAVEAVERYAAGNSTEEQLRSARAAAAAAVEEAQRVLNGAAGGLRPAIARWHAAAAVAALFSLETLIPALSQELAQGRSCGELIHHAVSFYPCSETASQGRPGQPRLVPQEESQTEAEWQAAIVRDIFGAYLDGDGQGECCVAEEPAGTAGPLPRLDVELLNGRDGTAIRLAQDITEDGAFERLPLLADALEDAGCTDAELFGHLRAPGPHVRGCWALDLALVKK
jgi:hypothetical protein